MKIPTKTLTLYSGRPLRVMGMFEGCILCPVGIFVFVFVGKDLRRQPLFECPECGIQTKDHLTSKV